MSEINNWQFREIVTKRWWDIGSPVNPTKVRHMAGFYDFRYAILKPWVGEVSLLELPGVNLRGKEASECENILNSGLEESLFDNNGCVTIGPFTGFGSDSTADTQTLRECRREKEHLQDLLDIASATGDLDAMAMITEQLRNLDRWTLDYFVPGGGIKKLNKGDPLDKAAGAARKRKSRAEAQLADFGLKCIADHWRTSYFIHPRTFTYCPLDPKPDWQC